MLVELLNSRNGAGRPKTTGNRDFPIVGHALAVILPDMTRTIYAPLLAGAIALFAVGCTEIRTQEPFGERNALGENDAKNLNGVWYSPATKREKRNKFTITLGADRKSGMLTTENAEGQTRRYTLEFREVGTGIKGSPESLVFYRPEDAPKSGWSFGWIGKVMNADEHDGVVLMIPDERAFRALGLPTAKFEDPGPPLGIPEKKDYYKSTGSLLTASPDEIEAKLRGKDLRTFMWATFPFVLLRTEPPMPPEPQAKPAEKASAKN